MDEDTQFISKYSELNQRFFKEEIFDPTHLPKLGFSTNDGALKHAYKDDENAQILLDQVTNFIINKETTTKIVEKLKIY